MITGRIKPGTVILYRGRLSVWPNLPTGTGWVVTAHPNIRVFLRSFDGVVEASVVPTWSDLDITPVWTDPIQLLERT